MPHCPPREWEIGAGGMFRPPVMGLRAREFIIGPMCDDPLGLHAYLYLSSRMILAKNYATGTTGALIPFGNSAALAPAQAATQAVPSRATPIPRRLT